MFENPDVSGLLSLHELTTGKYAERTERDFNLLLCHWSSQLFDLRASSSTDVPVLLLSQPNVWFKASSTRIRVKSYICSFKN